MLRRAKWIKGTHRSSYVGQHATVVKVQAAQALVRWLAATPVHSTSSLPGGGLAEVSVDPPAEMQRPSRLHELHQHHARACWRLGEHAALPPAETERRRAEQLGAAPPAPAADAVVDAAADADAESDGEVDADAAPAAVASKRNRSSRKRSAVETCVEVVGCHTRVDVIWQDGKRDDDVPGACRRRPRRPPTPSRSPPPPRPPAPRHRR